MEREEDERAKGKSVLSSKFRSWLQKTRNWLKWMKEPQWWSVVLAVVQLFAIGIVGILIDRRDKSQKQDREIAALEQRLEDQDPKAYMSAANDLIAFSPSKKDKVIIFASGVPCMPWQKARFLYSTILAVSKDHEDARKALNMLWSSWLCHQRSLGIDVQLYETLKSAPGGSCQLVSENLDSLLSKVTHDVDDLFSNEALYVVLHKTCPQTESRPLESFAQQIRRNFEEYSESIHVTAPAPYTPWIPNREIAVGSVVAEDDSWHEVFWGVFRTFSGAAREGTEVIVAQVAREPLLSRLIISQYLIRPGGEADKSVISEIEPRVRNWIELGLHSVEKECRYAAVTAVGNLELKEFRTTLQTMAQSDQDEDVRRRALQVLSDKFGF